MTYYHEILKKKNSKRHTPVKMFETEQDVLNYCKDNGLKYAGTPYIFTHIILHDGSMISQKCNGIMCSPETLKKQMEVKQ